MGFGASTNTRGGIGNLPQTTQEALANALWKEADFRVLRLWSSSGSSGDGLANNFGKYIQEAQKAQPNLVLLLAPTGWSQDLSSSAGAYAQQIKDLRDRHGIEINVTGISNEPDNNSGMKGWILTRIDECVIAMRQELDKRGLQDVKIIAPENCNVDTGALVMAGEIMSNGEALAALDGFAFHSYNMCMVREMRDLVAPCGKELWQTESSDNGAESDNDGRRASMQACRFLSDVNQDVQYWVHFLGYEGSDSRDNATRILGYDNSGSWSPFLKYFYYKQLSQAFAVGSTFRNATSDLGWLTEDASRWNNDWTNHMYADKCTRMEQTYGNKAPIVLAAAVRPDSSWAIGISNCSGAGGDIHGYYLDATTFDVTIFLEEMEGSGELEFEVYKSNESMRIQSQGSATMRDGEMSVTLAPFDLVTFISAPGIASPKLAAKKVPAVVPGQWRAVQGWLYDLRGRRVMKAGAAHYPVAGTAALVPAKGVYLYRAVEAPAAGMRACLPIR
jgi:hypothetical protein